MKYMRFVVFVSVMSLVAVFINKPSLFGYGWHTFVPYHILTCVVTMIMITLYMGRDENGKLNVFTKSWRKTTAWAMIVALAMGPFGIMVMIGTMLEHRVKYGRFVW